MLDKIKSLFQKKKPQKAPPIPEWDQIVELMHDKQLEGFLDEVVKTIYSRDRTMRYVVLRNERGNFSYRLETIHQFDGDEWEYLYSGEGTLPAMWELSCGISGRSLFSNEDEPRRELTAEPEYKLYF